ncbi:MAG: Hsp20/alpha crystallin family protein [Phycisphaerales bacterium]|nr:Hsp20/alpha crystallin family protein [Phycisphaerales bacterium]
MSALCTPRSLAFSMLSPGSAERELDRMVSTFFEASPFACASGAARNVARTGFPPINIWEDEHAFSVEAELPGFRLAELNIQLVGNELTISGTREIAEPTEGRVHRRERASGCFTRTLRLGADIDAEKVHASLDSGVLTVTLPRAENAKPRKIEIKPTV